MKKEATFRNGGKKTFNNDYVKFLSVTYVRNVKEQTKDKMVTHITKAK